MKLKELRKIGTSEDGWIEYYSSEDREEKWLFTTYLQNFMMGVYCFETSS
jgi:hypothetical protein